MELRVLKRSAYKDEVHKRRLDLDVMHSISTNRISNQKSYRFTIYWCSLLDFLSHWIVGVLTCQHVPAKQTKKR